MLEMRGSLWSHGSNSCKHFSLQRALHAGKLEAATLFLDAQEESLGPARDAPSHHALIHLGPRGVDSGFHLHLVLGMACIDLGLPSRPDVVVERHALSVGLEIQRTFREQVVMFPGRKQELVVESVVPDFLHGIPIRDDNRPQWYTSTSRHHVCSASRHHHNSLFDSFRPCCLAFLASRQ